MLRRHLVQGQHAAPEPPALAVAPAGLLDIARIAGLRDGLAQGMFARLVEQCAADMAERLDALAASVDHARGDHAPGETHGLAHALAGMAGSYGLAGFEGRMRAIMAAARREDVDEVRSLLAGAPAHFAASIAALREVIG